jgi:hypothetical protein
MVGKAIQVGVKYSTRVACSRSIAQLLLLPKRVHCIAKAPFL